MSDAPTTLIAQPFLMPAAQTISVRDQYTRTTVAAPSDGDPAASAVIFVASTADAPASGDITIYEAIGPRVEVIHYTSKTGGGTPSFNGCTGGIGVLSTGDVVEWDRTSAVAEDWFLHLLAPSTAAGASHEDPVEFARYLQALVRGTHTLWTLKWQQNGLYKWTYTGTGTGRITFSTTKIPAELGFAGTIGPLATNATAQATYAPSHCILSDFRPAEKDSDFQRKFGLILLTRLPDGRMDVLTSGKQVIDRMFSLHDHPRTLADAITRGTIITPVWPPVNGGSLWTDPVADMDTTPGQWTIHRAVATGLGLQLAYSFGDFQRLTASSPTVTYFDIGYWTEKVLSSKISVFQPPLISESMIEGLEVTRMATTGTTT
jgi:hypothetical protein